MSICLSDVRKCLLVLTLIMISAVMFAQTPETGNAESAANNAGKELPAAKSADGEKASLLEYEGIMISRANLLRLESDAQACLQSSSNLNLSHVQIRRIKVVLTGYSSTVAQTDSTPFITANGTYVRDGIVANNGLPFGTELRIPELFGDKIFSVQDRMHARKGSYHVDIWFPTYEQAKNFGVKYAYVEVIENN